MDEQKKLDMQKEGICLLAKNGEPKFTETWFPYTSGQVGPYYIQSIAVEQDGNDYSRSIDLLCNLIKETIGDDFDAISGGESRDWDFSNPAAKELNKPHIKIYKNGKVLGADPKGKSIVHIADLNNEGSSMRDQWMPYIQGKGGKIIYAFFFVDRIEDGTQVLDELNIPNDSVVPMDSSAWKTLHNSGYISDNQLISLEKRMEDKKSWAHDQLRKNPQGLYDLITSEDKKDVDKAKKIINEGYPEIKEELAGILRDMGYKKKI